MKTLIQPLSLCGLLFLNGCVARFSTTQIDERKNSQTGEATKITTKASAWTFNTAKSDLAKWKASQTERSQGAEVGGLSQESGGTNAVAVIRAIGDVVEKAAKTTP